jgi:hypothetical protein
LVARIPEVAMRRCIVLVVLSFAVACSSAGGSGAAPSGAPRAARGSADLITQDEIAAGSYQTALDIIENLRPAMMRPRVSSLTNSNTTTGLSEDRQSSVNVVAFLDEVKLGELAALRNVPANQVKEIRYVNSRDATTRWGTGFSSGVIQVITRK